MTRWWAMRTFTASFVFASLACLAIACTKAQPPPADPNADVDGPVACGAERFKARERCFDHAQEACDSLGCAHGCDILMARASKWVGCSTNEVSSSGLKKCAGYSNWQCPEDTRCVMEPNSVNIDDATGTCAAVDGGSTGTRCGGFSGVPCASGLTCRTNGHCFDCWGVCVAPDAGVR